MKGKRARAKPALTARLRTVLVEASSGGRASTAREARLRDAVQALVDGDSLTVAPIKSEVTNQILLRGAVARPGGYAWSEGMRVSDLLGSLDDDLLSETDLSTGLVVRRTGVGLEIEPLALNLGR